jgi:DUF1680 family protein
MESHALHGLGIYYESPDTLWVNLFAPSTAEFSNGVLLTMDTGFPDGDTATITLKMTSPKTFTLAVRRPVWAGDGFAIKVNGARMEQPPLASLRDASAGGRGAAPGNEAALKQSSTYVEIRRTWKTGDSVELSLPKSLQLEPTPDNRQVAAILWGPLVLAGDLGPRRENRGGGNRGDAAAAAAAEAARLAEIPVFVAADRPLTDWVVSGSRAGDYRTQQAARVPAQPSTLTDVSLTPFYRTHRRNYSVYFDVLTQSEFESRAKK